MYGDYAAQPALGFLNAREGILGQFARETDRKLAGARGRCATICGPTSSARPSSGVGYVDDCLILALNYITDYAYSGSVNVNHTFMMQLSLRTLGGNTSGQSTTGLNSALAGTGVR